MVKKRLKMKKVIFIIIPMVLLTACEKKSEKVKLDCVNWNVDAEIYKDKIVMDITNKFDPNKYKKNKSIPAEFLIKDKTVHVETDRNIFVMGDSIKDSVIEYYKSFKELQTNDNNDVNDSVGLSLNNKDGYYTIGGLSFGFTFAYDCKVIFDKDN